MTAKPRRLGRGSRTVDRPFWFVLAWVALGLAASCGSAPTVGIRPLSGSWDTHVGRVPFGTRVAHRFEFVNGSSVSIRIERVRADCTCHQLEFPHHELEPGQRSALAVGVDVRGRGRDFGSVFHVIGGPLGADAVLLGTFTLRAEIERTPRLYADPSHVSVNASGELHFQLVLTGIETPQDLDGLQGVTTGGFPVPLVLGASSYEPSADGEELHVGVRAHLSDEAVHGLGTWGSLQLILPASGDRPALGARLGLRKTASAPLDTNYVFAGMLRGGTRLSFELPRLPRFVSATVAGDFPWLVLRADPGLRGSSLHLDLALDAPLGTFEVPVELALEADSRLSILLAGVVR